jgi:CBS domain containing-hemolysin-like protein
MDAEQLPGDVAGLNQTQMNMIEGALKINELKVKDIMTKINHVTSLPLDAILDQQLLARIK